MTDENRIPVDPDQVDWNKCTDGLVPAVVQDERTGRVLMLGWMNRESLQQTIESGKVTFFSRSRQRLWTKGESSGHFLRLTGLDIDCDNDTLLVIAQPDGPTCHRGSETCFSGAVQPNGLFLSQLHDVITQRRSESPESSYTARLLASGIDRLAQKTGEEGVEVALAAVSRDDSAVLDEVADLFYHVLVLLAARNLRLDQLLDVLAARHKT